MTYRILIKSSARRELDALARKHRAQVERRIQELSEQPRPPGVVYHRGQYAEYCRIRSGDYRIIYHIQDEQLAVLVIALGHRREVYRGY